jgi:hypothetical protein
MAALEYLTGNALTAHPFKLQKNTTFVPTHPIGGNEDTSAVWFYDILFVSFLADLRRVYISNIAKISSTQVEIVFNDYDTGAIITPNEQPAILTLTNHYKNTVVSFASHQTSGFAVKVVFGPGLLLKPNFSQAYPKELTELSSSAIILKSPRVASLSFSAYNSAKARTLGLAPSHKFSVNTYTKNSTEPKIKLKHNLVYSAESSSAVGLFVSRGSGEGLYNPCPEAGDIEDIYSISLVTPNENGGILLNTSSCYSANTLTSNDIILLGDGVLAPYRSFELYSTSGPPSTFNAVSAGSSIFFENFCKPKCAPEQIQAFAHYLNRVTDGAQEVDYIAAKNSETRGVCNIQNNVLTALSFCSDSTLATCNAPCTSSFIKNFHEGRNIQVTYSSTDTQIFKIMEVISSSIVALDQLANYGTALAFKVLDNGVIRNMNCAIAEYNAKALTFLRPYFNVKYTTAESYSSTGIYSTYLSVVVAIFNPSNEPVAVRVDFLYSVFAKEGKFKIRKASGVEVSNTTETYVGCREYVFLEAIFSIACGVTGGYVELSVFDITTGIDIQIGETYALPGINGVPCPSNSPTPQVVPLFKLLQYNWSGYSKTITTNNSVTSVIFGGNIPSWLSLNFSAPRTITLSTPTAPDTQTSQLYEMTYKPGAGATQPFKLLYIINPTISAPLTTTYPSSAPLLVNKDITYTLQSPLLHVTASNMTMLVPDFPADEFFYYYIVHVLGNSSMLPSGLSFDKTAGKLVGKLSSSVRVGSKITLYVSARNPAGFAINSQLIYLEVVSDSELPYIGTMYYYEGTGETDTYSTWASLTAWYEDSLHTTRAAALPSGANPVILLNDTSANIETWTAPASINLNGHTLTLKAHPLLSSCASAAVFSTDVTSIPGGSLIFDGHIEIT